MTVELGGDGLSACASAAVAAAFLWHLRRSRAGRGLKALRAAAALALIAALLKPTLALKTPLLVKPKVAILLDASHSMQARSTRASRLEDAQRFLSSNRRRIEPRADATFYAVGGRGRRLSGWDEALALKPGDSALQPGLSIADVAQDPSGAAPQRVWLFSDGNAEPHGHGFGAEPAQLPQALAALKAPLDAVAVGPQRRGQALAFIDVKPPDFAFLHGRFSVAAALEASGLAGKPVAVRLSREKPGGGSWETVVERALAPVSEFDTLSSTWDAVAQALGTQRYRIEAVAGSARAVRDFRVEVVRQKYRIMYLSGRPSPGYAFLREFLKADPNHELVSFVILRNPENPTLVPDNELSLIPFPAEEIFVQSLSQFDLFILENFSYARFHLPVSYLASLRSFVSAGGALLVIGGENAFDLGGYRGTPLEDMLPVSLASTAPDFVGGPFSARPAAKGHPLVQLYDSAEESERAWQALPRLEGWARFASVRPNATVLAVHPAERTESGQPLPVAALRDYGRGKVMLVSTDSTWRWRLGAASDWRASSFYGRFWSRVVQYLTGTLDLSKVKFAPLPDRLAPREPALFTLRVFDESFQAVERAATQLTVLWTPPGSPAREVPASETQPGLFSIELTGLSPGTHRLRASAKYRGRPWGQDEMRFVWEAPGQEPPVDRKWLKATAESTGGSFFDLSSLELDSLLDRLPPVRAESEVRRRCSPWASALWLWLTAALWLSEWTWRRWKGFL